MRPVANLFHAICRGTTIVAFLAISPLIDQRLIADDDPSSEEFFERRIRPILMDYCVDCHGPDLQESGLRVDHIDFLKRKATYGTAISDTSPEESLLLQVMFHSDPDLRMPEGGDRLPDEVLEDFRAWVVAGAVWPEEPRPSDVAEYVEAFNLDQRKQRLPWIWRQPTRQSLPIVQALEWPSDRLDYFILEQLEENGLEPAPRAEPLVWFRRVHYALTGLPPTAEQVQQFAVDASVDLNRSKQEVVDRLLASPRFGERWARHWMDLVRYSETRGHESDFPIANAWRYRDYLIQAFNEDVSYDQFVIEQVAGDLLSTPRIDQADNSNQSVLGTGWVFLGEEVHSPVDIRKDELDRIDNKIDVFSKTFLGLTLACARCHDHKFDAIRQDDYYALAGFFLSSNYRQVRFQSDVQNREISARLDVIERSTQEAMREVIAVALSESMESSRSRWMAELSTDRSSLSPVWQEALAEADNDLAHPLYLFRQIHLATSITDPDCVQPSGDQREAISRVIREWQVAQDARDEQQSNFRTLVDFQEAEAEWYQDGHVFGTSPRLAGTILIGDANQPVLGVSTRTAAVKSDFWDGLQVSGGNETDSGSQAAHLRAGKSIRTNKIDVQSGKLYYLINGSANVYAGVDSHIMVAGPLHGHLLKRVEGELSWHEHDVSASEGERVYAQIGAITGQPLEVYAVVESNQPPALLPTPNLLIARQIDGFDEQQEHVASMFFDALVESIERWKAPESCTPSELQASAELVSWMLDHPELFSINEEARIRLVELVTEYRTERDLLQQEVMEQSATAVALMDGNGVDEWLLDRGNADKPLQQVPRGLPVALPNVQPIQTASSGRLELARQMTRSDNPLVSRVLVNRIWHQIFGRGIVATTDNFGWLGERPTHPALLDDLAWSFQHEESWSIKRMIRRMVLSETFAMSSHEADERAAQIDPENRFLHRMPVRRLEAEAIRDTVLAISGRGETTMYGKPVPVHLTDFVVGRGAPAQSGPLDGDGRRSVYIALRRNFIPTLMLAFDFPTPFSTVGRRNVTNVPAQSLALMNDDFIYQQAQFWANRHLILYPNDSDSQRINRMFFESLGRTSNEVELANCLRLVQELRSKCEDEREAWSEFAHALMNLNEFIYLK